MDGVLEAPAAAIGSTPGCAGGDFRAFFAGGRGSSGTDAARVGRPVDGATCAFLLLSLVVSARDLLEGPLELPVVDMAAGALPPWAGTAGADWVPCLVAVWGAGARLLDILEVVDEEPTPLLDEGANALPDILRGDLRGKGGDGIAAVSAGSWAVAAVGGAADALLAGVFAGSWDAP